MKKYHSLSLLLLLAVATQSCQNDFDTPALTAPKATLEANITLADFKKAYQDENAKLLTAEDNHIIRGRVISSDATGNIYQSLVIQDETAALPISIRRASLYADYHVGQEVVINTAGLWIGKYNGLEQLGWLGEPYNGEDQLTFMSFAEFSSHTQLNGLPEPQTTYVLPGKDLPENGIYCLVETIDNLPTDGDEMYALQGQLVEFRNASFEGAGQLDYAPYQENANRYLIQDGQILKLTVRNSGYSTFYNDILPEGKGTVRGILSWYGDGSSSTTGVFGGWQLLLRSTDDVIMDSKGSQSEPYTLAEAIELQNQGISGWTEGYIVGSIMAGVDEVTSADQVIFGPDAELPTNLLVAPTADCKDLSLCVAVDLPANSDLRKYGNLLENPAVYGKSISIAGEFKPYLGLPGVISSGDASDFIIDGVVIGGDDPNPPATGNGTADNPYTVSAVLGGATGTSAWVEGYIVGFIAGKSIQDGAVFSNDVSGKDYTNTNIMIADTPDCTDVSKCVPVQLPNTGDFRSQLGLGNNPSAYKRKVKICGSLEAYFGQKGVKSLTEWSWVGEGGTPVTPPDDPTDPDVGTGTQTDPFNVASIISGAAKGSDVWVGGYVVGYIEGMAYAGATFALPGEGADYTQTNLLLGPTPDCKDASKCIPVQLPNTGDIRAKLGLGNNPDIYLKKVLLKGNIEKYFGQPGFKGVSEYVIE